MKRAGLQATPLASARLRQSAREAIGKPDADRFCGKARCLPMGGTQGVLADPAPGPADGEIAMIRETTLPQSAPQATGLALDERPCDALELLCREHESARVAADECRRQARSVAPDDLQIQSAAEHLCQLLRRLSEIEEGYFYPAARAALQSPQLVDLAALEHATARQIIRQLHAAVPADARYEALVVALSDCVDRHVRHEQGVLFPSLREAALDLEALGRQLRECRGEGRRTH